MLNTLGGVNTKKKIIIVSTLLLVISLSVFILGNKSKKTTCQYDSSQKDYQISTKYNIYSKKNIVGKVVSKSIIKSSDEKKLKQMKKEYEKQYKTLNKKYSGYKYNLKITKNKLYIKLTILYNKIDMKKFIYDNGAMKSYLDENKNYPLTKAIDYYTSIGVSCK